jgi:hypothetical protein
VCAEEDFGRACDVGGQGGDEIVRVAADGLRGVVLAQFQPQPAQEALDILHDGAFLAWRRVDATQRRKQLHQTVILDGDFGHGANDSAQRRVFLHAPLCL